MAIYNNHMAIDNTIYGGGVACSGSSGATCGCAGLMLAQITVASRWLHASPAHLSHGLSTTVIVKVTLRHKRDSTDHAAADCADFAPACRFRSFRRFYVRFFPDFPVMLIVLDH